MARACRDDLPDEHSETFLRRGLDRPNQIELPQEIRFCAHERANATPRHEAQAIQDAAKCPLPHIVGQWKIHDR
jgi:hypothetical protein